MILKAIIAVALITGANVASAQQQLNNQSILKMHDAGLGDDLIIAAINAQAGAYTTNTDDLIALKKAGVDDKIITAMVTKGSAVALPPSVLAGPLENPPVADPVGKPRVFLTSASKGTNAAAARDQSMEMSKDFEQFCPEVRITLNQQAADYTVSLNHIEIGLFIRDNQFQIADHNGDLISHTKEGGSIAGGIKKACGALMANWQTAHPSPPSAPAGVAPPPVVAPSQVPPPPGI